MTITPISSIKSDQQALYHFNSLANELLKYFVATFEDQQNSEDAAFNILGKHPHLENSLISENFTLLQKAIHRKALSTPLFKNSYPWIDKTLEWMHWISLAHANQFPLTECCWTLLYEELFMESEIIEGDLKSIQDLADRIATSHPDLLNYLRVRSIEALKIDARLFIREISNRPDLEKNFLVLLSRVYLASLEGSQVYQLICELEIGEDNSILHCQERSDTAFWKKLLAIPENQEGDPWRVITQRICSLASETGSRKDPLQLKKDLHICNVVSGELAALRRDLAHFTPGSLEYEQFCFLIKQSYSQDGISPLFPQCKQTLANLEYQHKNLRKKFRVVELHRKLLAHAKELHKILNSHVPPSIPSQLFEFFFYFDVPIYEACASLLFHAMAAAYDASKWPLSWLQIWEKTRLEYSLDLRSPEQLDLPAYQQFIHKVWDQIGPPETDLSELLKRRIKELSPEELQTLIHSMNAELSPSQRSQALITYFSEKLGRTPDLHWLIEDIL